jgi:hypothetical protein
VRRDMVNWARRQAFECLMRNDGMVTKDDATLYLEYSLIKFATGCMHDERTDAAIAIDVVFQTPLATNSSDRKSVLCFNG